MENYRPGKLQIVEGGFKTPVGGFKIVDSDLEDNQLATVLEFNPLNSDLPIEEVKEFAEFLIGYYNHNYR